MGSDGEDDVDGLLHTDYSDAVDFIPRFSKSARKTNSITALSVTGFIVIVCLNDFHKGL